MVIIEAWLLWGVLFGSIGMGMVVYGKKQKVTEPFVCGLALMVFPYFVSGTTALVVIGTVIILAGFFVRI